MVKLRNIDLNLLVILDTLLWRAHERCLVIRCWSAHHLPACAAHPALKHSAGHSPQRWPTSPGLSLPIQPTSANFVARCGWSRPTFRPPHLASC